MPDPSQEAAGGNFSKITSIFGPDEQIQTFRLDTIFLTRTFHLKSIQIITQSYYLKVSVKRVLEVNSHVSVSETK